MSLAFYHFRLFFIDAVFFPYAQSRLVSGLGPSTSFFPPLTEYPASRLRIRPCIGLSSAIVLYPSPLMPQLLAASSRRQPSCHAHVPARASEMPCWLRPFVISGFACLLRPLLRKPRNFSPKLAAFQGVALRRSYSPLNAFPFS